MRADLMYRKAMRDLVGYIRQAISFIPLKKALFHKQDSLPITPGVRGWLFVFCLTLIIFYPITGVLIFFAGLYSDLDYAFIPLVSIFGIYTGIQLWKIRPYAFDKVKIFLIAYLLASLYKTFVPIYWISHYGNKVSFSIYDGMKFIGEMIFFTIWYMYLTRSKRVKLTYLSKRYRNKTRKRPKLSKKRHRIF